MNKIRLLTALILWCAVLTAGAQQLYVGSYNIRYHNSGDDRNGDVWAKRCQVICDQVNFESPDIFGAQEVLAEQLQDLLKGLDRYDYIGVGRDDGRTEGEYAAIFYNRQSLRLLRHDNFWLSETPSKPSLGWDAACVRICTWGEFEQKATGLRFFYFNLHMDHVGVTARREAAKLVVARIAELAGDCPVVLTGDFNVDQTDEIYTIFTSSPRLDDSYEVAERRYIENGTFNDFKPWLKTPSRIDHVFVSPDFKVLRYGVLPNIYWTENTKPAAQTKSANAPQEISFTEHVLRLASDHYPVFVRLECADKARR